MTRHSLCLTALLVLIACDDTPALPDGLILSPNGYSGATDACRLAFESAVTADYLDDAADLVACPVGVDAPQSPTAFPVRQVAQLGGYAFYTVPRR